MNELMTFNYQSNNVRTVQKDGEPWFVLKDVCTVLDLGSAHKVADRLDEDERNQIPLTDSLGRMQETTIINESGLYNVILRSDKPEAKPFRKWVTSEVLPTIRKTGSYGGVNLSNLSPELQVLINLEQRQKEQQKAIEDVNQRLDGIREIMCIHPDNWRRDCRKLLSKIAISRGGLEAYPDINNEAFELVELRGHCNLNRRLVNQKNRMREAGATLKALKDMNRVDVIADDPRLTEIYIAVVKELAVKYGVK